LAGDWLRNPVKVEVAPRNTVTETIQHTVLHVTEREKSKQLVSLLQEGKVSQALVFCNTKIGANRLTRQLQNKDIHSEAIHSDRSQSERTAALDNFKVGKTKVLVATDIAARGLDIEQLPHVVNYDLPHNSEDYVHRIGRTGRAGQKGEAISFCTPEDKESVRGIEKLINKKLEISKPLGGSHHSAAPPSSRTEREQSKSDSFFSKPYVAQGGINGKVKVAAKDVVSSSNRSAKKQPIAALFMPPPGQKKS
jgi:ATP-dependent RNA helicase RhlE